MRTLRLGSLTTLIAVAALWTACRPQPPAPSATRPQRADANRPSAVRVGAWNIEWLGSPDMRSGPARDIAQTADDLAEYILAANVAVLGLEEIGRSEPEWTNATLQAALDKVGTQTGGHWEQRLFPCATGRNQLCGIAWDAARVTAVGEPRPVLPPDDEGDDQRSAWSRPPYGQAFTTGDGWTDFVVIPVHMKSNYRGDFSERRAEQARELTAAFASLYEELGERDVFIVGDLNCGGHAEPAITAYCGSGLVDLNSGDQPTHIRYGPLDRILVPADQPEFAERHFEVFRDPFLQPRNLDDEAFKKRFSDHFMVITEVKVLPDDD